MATKKASAATVSNSAHAKVSKVKAKANASATTTKATAMKKSTKQPATKKKAAPQTLPTAENTEIAEATKGKRKGTGVDARPTTNGVKRRKPSNEEDAAASSVKRRAKDEPPTPTAAKKPKATKSKVVLNHAPTKRLHVYVFGDGSNGELGLGTGKGQTEVKRPRLNPLLAADTVGVVHIAVGGMHTAALTHDNRILTWGVNDQGALGRDTKWDGGLVDIHDNGSDDESDHGSTTGINPKESVPGEVDMSAFPKGTVITQLIAGDSTTFALTDEGFVYGWGTFRGNDGILGFSSLKQIEFTPVRVDGLKKITKLACGANHVLALDSRGAVFAWGSGQQNQLGRRIVERTKLNALTPREFALPKGVVDIGAGSYNSFAVHKTKGLFAWGLNSYGETGLTAGAGEDEAVILHPTVIESLKDRGQVTHIEGGAHHTIAVTETGECLVWGRVDGFQTGLRLDSLPEEDVVRDSKKQPRILTVPTRVPGFQAAYATAGSDHCVAISKDGKAYSWGFSATYQTGLGQDDDVEEATLIDNTAVRGQRLVWAGAGGQFSVIAASAKDGTSMVNGVNGH